MIPRKKPGRLDDVRSNGWLDAMKSSSPPSRKVQKEAGVEDFSDDAKGVYSSWMFKYPSALNSFQKIVSHAKNKEIVYQLVGLTELYYAGSHGMDIMLPIRSELCTNGSLFKSTDQQGKEVNLFQPAREFLPMIDEVLRILNDKIKQVKGAKVENHKSCASVHYRNVDENVLEIRPVIDWDKGKAVEFLLESLGFRNSHDALPIYIGDDRTDEDAFKVLKGTYQGYGILVSAIPKESNVKEFLGSLAKIMGSQ
ncbi:unnamed protein product [Withania somnifera]